MEVRGSLRLVNRPLVKLIIVPVHGQFPTLLKCVHSSLKSRRGGKTIENVSMARE